MADSAIGRFLHHAMNSWSLSASCAHNLKNRNLDLDAAATGKPIFMIHAAAAEAAPITDSEAALQRLRREASAGIIPMIARIWLHAPARALAKTANASRIGACLPFRRASLAQALGKPAGSMAAITA
jgi:hypothetical protein